MESYRVIVEYRVKKGMEEEGATFFENDVSKAAKECGCHDMELLQNEDEPSRLIAVGIYDSLEDAHTFEKNHWAILKKKAASFCSQAPTRDVLKIKSRFESKLRKVA